MDTGFPFGMMVINVLQPHRGSVCTQHVNVMSLNNSLCNGLFDLM